MSPPIQSKRRYASILVATGLDRYRSPPDQNVCSPCCYIARLSWPTFLRIAPGSTPVRMTNVGAFFRMPDQNASLPCCSMARRSWPTSLRSSTTLRASSSRLMLGSGSSALMKCTNFQISRMLPTATS